ncbi:uncharacterized protein LOC131669789 [Phymastichus coffea]|uniref:uncharacterized protein LOC131669789 n=1 Tax=Phymastichus coffea TaxID=108790 RepID=UPI00273A9C6A|nr:uncharacterized protein LOC131669789 [Phymastichus coffea]
MSRVSASAPTLAAILVAASLLVRIAEARPSRILSRPKRVSDQRLAELETLVSLAKMKGKLITVPIGYGHVDPYKLGRRRRSSTESDLSELRRILRSVVVDNVQLSPRDRGRFAQLLSSQWEATDQEETASDEDELQSY